MQLIPLTDTSLPQNDSLFLKSTPHSRVEREVSSEPVSEPDRL